MLAKNEDVPSKFMNNLALILRRAMFQDMLNDIVPILILHKSLSVLVQFLQYGTSLFWHAVLQDALDHTTAIRMSGQGIHLHR